MGVCAMDMLVLICHVVYGCVCHGYAGNDILHGVCAMDMLLFMCNMVYGCVCHGYAGIDMQHGVWVCVPWICWY